MQLGTAILYVPADKFKEAFAEFEAKKAQAKGPPYAIPESDISTPDF
jgi:hypothetical protein